MTFSAAIKRTLSDQLVDDLGRKIVQGILRPGDTLPGEDVLLARYGVSRTVLREALQVLAAKGLLDARPRRGTTIRPRAAWSQLDPLLLHWHGELPADDPALQQLMEVRRIVEPPAAALASRRATEADRARIAAAYAAMEAAGENVEAFIQADLEFHTALLEASGNQFLIPIVHAIRTTLLASLHVTNTEAEQNRRVSLPLHATILRAILEGDHEGAAAAMQQHLDDTERLRVQASQGSPRPQPS
ncbi:FadR/GntR family transcriptional regulator [Roseomonas sp. E05]|uniref:FadR/GntR family transcriptional regulator n=1 Tax=Roseomonas sp. E05 TaxID=3046310 RepID=UPI0024B921F1|nr:FadR/GntR family transcriptional regulator [Roseomonas sp. E05]MDJ0388937.1 FadR/GntR family transcriptional regulator [Roseomonas sp. E05]